MKILSKLWEWLTIFFLGVIAGIVIFIKFLDSPETVNEIVVKKIKTKNSDGNTIDLNLEIDDKDEEHNVKNKKKIRIRNWFKNK